MRKIEFSSYLNPNDTTEQQAGAITTMLEDGAGNLTYVTNDPKFAAAAVIVSRESSSGAAIL